MGVPTPAAITEAWGINADPTLITYPIPVPTQLPGNPGRASFNDGFPQANFLPTALGGIPPSGKDFNGILAMVTAYCAAIQAGQFPQHDAAVSAAIGGYAKGALLANDAQTGFWISAVASNVTDPDTGGAGWISFPPTPVGLVATAITGGAHNDYNPAGFGPTTGFLDLSPAADANITGILAGGDGQALIITNLSAHNLTLDSLNGGSAAGNQLRMAFDLTLTLNNSARFVYSAALSLWVQA